MGTAAAINFEDLFDFSPEPVDRDQGDYIEDQSANPPIHLTEQRTYTTLRPAQSQSPRTFLPDRLSLSPKTSKLSASLPTGWASNLSASYTGSSSPGSSEFSGRAVGSGESFGHLVEDLTSAVHATTSTTAATTSSGGSEGSKGKRGRKPGQKSSKPDMKNKLERSRQSARECRARKKLRYQYLDDMIIERERANLILREELLRYQAWCHELDKGKIPDGLKDFLRQIKNQDTEQQSYQQL